MVTREVQEALNILGLNLIFSAEQLKTAYRAKAKQSHPDTHDSTEEANKQMQAVNAAYELLKEYLKNKDKYTVHTNNAQQGNVHRRSRRNNSVDQFELNKRQAIIILKSYIEHVNKLANHELADAIRVYARKMQESVAYYELKIHSCMNELELIRIYDEAERVMSRHLTIVYNAFITKYPYIKEVNFIPNYNLNLTKFVEELDNTLNIVGSKLIKLLMVKVKDIYQFNISYNDLKTIVAQKANDVVNNILVNPTTRKEQIDTFFLEIEALFKENYELKQKQRLYNEVSLAVGEVGSVILKQRLDSLNINSEYFYDEINYLRNEINSIKNKTYVSKIRKYLLERYTEAISKPENISNAHEYSALLNSALEVLDRYKDGFITYDIVAFLYTVNFEDLKQDSRIIEYVANNYVVPNPGYAYMTTSEYSSISSFANLTYNDVTGYNFIYKGVYGCGVLHPKTAADLSEDFISLSKFLSSAAFVGKRCRTTSGTALYVLYEFDKKMIALSENGKVLSINSDRIVEMEDKKYMILDIYKDKKRMLDKISERIREDYQEDKKFKTK